MTEFLEYSDSLYSQGCGRQALPFVNIWLAKLFVNSSPFSDSPTINALPDTATSNAPAAAIPKQAKKQPGA